MEIRNMEPKLKVLKKWEKAIAFFCVLGGFYLAGKVIGSIIYVIKWLLTGGPFK